MTVKFAVKYIYIYCSVNNLFSSFICVYRNHSQMNYCWKDLAEEVLKYIYLKKEGGGGRK